MAKATRDGRWSENERGEAVFHRPEGGTVTYGHDGSVVTEHRTPQGHHATVERAGERIERDIRLVEVKGFGPTHTEQIVSTTTHHADGSVSHDQHSQTVLPDDDSRLHLAESTGPGSGGPPSYDVLGGAGGAGTPAEPPAAAVSSSGSSSVPTRSPGGWEYDPTETPQQNAAAAAAWDDLQRGPDWSAVGAALGSFAEDVAKVAAAPEVEGFNVLRYSVALGEVGAAAAAGDRPALAEALTSMEMVGLDLVPGSDALAGAWDLNTLVLRAGGSSETIAPTSGQAMDAEVRTPLAAANAAMLGAVVGTGGGTGPGTGGTGSGSSGGGGGGSDGSGGGGGSDAQGTSVDATGNANEHQNLVPPGGEESAVDGQPGDAGHLVGSEHTDPSASDGRTRDATDHREVDPGGLHHDPEPGYGTDGGTGPSSGHDGVGPAEREPAPHGSGGPLPGQPAPHDVAPPDSGLRDADAHDRTPQPTDGSTSHHDRTSSPEQTRTDDTHQTSPGPQDLSPADHAPDDGHTPSPEGTDLHPADAVAPVSSDAVPVPDVRTGEPEQKSDTTPSAAHQQPTSSHPGMDHHDYDFAPD